MTTGGDVDAGPRGSQSAAPTAGADRLALDSRDVAALPMVDCSATIVVAVGAFIRANAPAG